MIERLKQAVCSVKHAHPVLTKIVTAGCCVAVFGLVVAGYSAPRQVTVMVDDSIVTTSTVYETTCRSVEAFLEKHTVDFEQGKDLMDVEQDAAIEDGMTIHITKEFDIQVTADGKTTTFAILPATAGEAVQQLGIRLGEDDIVEPDLDTPLKKGDSLVVKRVAKVLEYKDETVDYDVVYQADGSITIGDTQVTQKGRQGKVRKTYEVTYVDGEKTDRQLVESEVVTQARDKVIGYGTKISFTKPEGLKYTRKIEDVKAVSYYYSGNPVGCYGLPCEFGTVAVDRSLIPLGSLLYIEGYGYAIANDVGSAIHGKIVDLYMEKYEQCLIWGARRTTVYVIDEG